MPWLFQLLLVTFALSVPFYLYSVFKLYGIIKAEKPEWVAKRGSLSFFYDHLPRVGDPNVSTAVIRIAFGSRVAELRSPDAAWHARVIRVLLPAGLLAFALVFVWALRTQP